MKRMHLSQLMTVSLFPQEEMMRLAGLCWESEVLLEKKEERRKARAAKTSPAVRAVIDIQDFRLSPSPIVGIAPVQALTSIGPATIGPIQQ
jgi:hypothetical protein